MLDKLYQNREKIVLTFFLIGLLAMVRNLESILFYDPFIAYFKKDFATLPFPVLNPFKLFLHLFFRYSLNSILSLAIIYVLFKETSVVVFSFFLFVFFFIILNIVFFSMIYLFKEESNWLLFYVRRFLIQPIFVILFIPAFYYQKLSTEK